MLSLVRLFTDIALLRRGPEELPASAFLLVGTMGANFLVNFLVSTLLPPIAGPWHLHLVVDVVFTLAWYVALMRLFSKPERFLQTTTAVFGYQAVLAPALVATAWFASRFQHDDAAVAPIAIAGLGMLAWVLAANARILRSALDQPMPICVSLALLQIVVGQLVLLGLFPPHAAS